MDGILAINKPRGMTSHDVVFKLRKILQTKKVGHTGTLDPDVNGVLPICVGRATRVSDYMMDSGKTYIAEITLGTQTTTEDQTGDVIATNIIEENQYTNEQIDNALTQLTGEIEQTPPMFSAVKVNGRKLYEYAREGKVIDRPSRKVRIYNITRTSQPTYHDNQVTFEIIVKCGKGTYIRTLATQIAEQLHTIGHMSKLTRTESGGFTLEQSYTLEDLKAMPHESIQSILHPLEKGLTHLPHHEVDADTAQRIMWGQKLKDITPVITEETVMIHHNKALAIYMPHPDHLNVVKARKVFTD
ncbi:tRNA pseudouridine(55) synthase TruB [Macrococcus animalis]|uniref:tRNA pseudouridine(55) synthase TruB n=1 Tax=Macrococcus animalis TaxID=3395467 RepID=UPI0039BDE575